jgi:predicted DCC family thiol-disulfide oxidoreductase YuxK
MAGPYVLLYDRDCGICSAVSRWIHRVDLRGRIRVESIQSGRALLAGIPEERMLDAMHIVTPDGQVTTGGDAVPTLVGAFPIGAGLGRLLQGSSGLMRQVRRFYAFLTRFRDRLVCRLDAAPPSADSSP